MIQIYTDGSCKKGGDGGWGVAVYEDNILVSELFGGELDTTNNRMELLAFIKALQYAYDNNIRDAEVFSDSMYVIKGTTEWLRNWIAKDYSGVKNCDMWRRIEKANFIWGTMNIQHIKGHAGHEGNEKADALANRGVSELRSGVWK
tara:strand:+ start:293 stop:730 length:438 start_codon:yes stop_codon:yes gene_type:complete